MAITKSAKKAYKRSEKLREKNLKFKMAMKISIKMLKKALDSWRDSKEIQSFFNEAYSNIDKAARKNIIHKNKAAREKSRIAKLIS